MQEKYKIGYFNFQSSKGIWLRIKLICMIFYMHDFHLLCCVSLHVALLDNINVH